MGNSDTYDSVTTYIRVDNYINGYTKYIGLFDYSESPFIIYKKIKSDIENKKKITNNIYI